MSSELWKNKNYLLDIPYVIAHHIYEYDIQKANINVLRELNIIDDEFYDRLSKMQRMQRQVEIGYLIKYNSGVGDKLAEGILLFKKKFFEANNIDDNDILSIKNDAVFLIDKNPEITDFGIIHFIKKNSYTSYLKLLRNIEVYFEFNAIDCTISLDIKGISDENLEKHHQYMATFIADVLYYIETGDISSALTYVSEFYNNYIERKLHPGYYRNFNADSDYTIMANGIRYSTNYCDSANMLNSLDISNNLEVIRTINGYLTQMYFMNNK